MFPLDIVDGLVYLCMHPYTDAEYEELPHVPFTSDVTWDTTVLDCTISSDHPNWHDNLKGGEYESHFDPQGRYLHRDRGEMMDDIITTDVNYIAHSTHLDGILCCKSHTRPAKRDLESYHSQILCFCRCGYHSPHVQQHYTVVLSLSTTRGDYPQYLQIPIPCLQCRSSQRAARLM
jgi:hypothetical protein